MVELLLKTVSCRQSAFSNHVWHPHVFSAHMRLDYKNTSKIRTTTLVEKPGQ